jgi:hypothetical protein
VPDEHWELVRPEKEAAGYDREAYQYEIEVQRQIKISGLTGISMTGASSGNTFLLKLDGPLNNPTKGAGSSRLASHACHHKGHRRRRQNARSEFLLYRQCRKASCYGLAVEREHHRLLPDDHTRIESVEGLVKYFCTSYSR